MATTTEAFALCCLVIVVHKDLTRYLTDCDACNCADLAGVVGEPFPVFVIGRSQQQHAEDNAPRHDDDVGGVAIFIVHS